MSVFHYKAFNAEKQVVENQLEAADRNAALAQLKASELLPISLNESSGSPAGASQAFAFKRERIRRKDITQFTNQLSALIHAKMTIANSLQSLQDQSTHEGMKRLITSLLKDVNEGIPFSDSLEKHPKYFSSLYANMIRIGESSGLLDNSLKRLVAMRNREDALISKIKNALTYPCIMACVMCLSLVVMLTFVVPKFKGVFTQMGTALPFPTKVVIFVSGVFEKGWWIIIPLILACGFGIYYALKQENIRLKVDQFRLWMPGLGIIFREISISRFALSLGALLNSGVTMIVALESTCVITGNRTIETILKRITREVREGKSLSQALRDDRSGIFPKLLIGMTATGETAGNLDEMLVNVGEFYSGEAEARINTVTSLFEPVLILIMGGLVGFIISAILLPIFDLSTSIH